LALAALTASILGLFSTTTATVLERRVEIGLMRALGAGSSQVAALLLGETALVSLAGGMLGWTLGSAGAALIRGETFGSGGAPPLLLLPVAMVLSLSIGALGTLGPLRVALRTREGRGAAGAGGIPGRAGVARAAELVGARGRAASLHGGQGRRPAGPAHRHRPRSRAAAPSRLEAVAGPSGLAHGRPADATARCPARPEAAHQVPGQRPLARAGRGSHARGRRSRRRGVVAPAPRGPGAGRSRGTGEPLPGAHRGRWRGGRKAAAL